MADSVPLAAKARPLLGDLREWPAVYHPWLRWRHGREGGEMIQIPARNETGSPEFHLVITAHDWQRLSRGADFVPQRATWITPPWIYWTDDFARLAKWSGEPGDVEPYHTSRT